MQKGKNTIEDTKQERRRKNHTKRKNIFFLNASNIEPFEKITLKLTGTFYNSKLRGNSIEKDKCRISSKDTV
jgi:hypothetical protein